MQIVIRESDRLNNIITDFLAYSRGKQYRLERVNLIPLLEDTLTLMENRLIAENSGIRMERGFPTGGLGFSGRRQIEAGVLELLREAVRAMKKREES